MSMNSTPSPHPPPSWLADQLRNLPAHRIGGELERLIRSQELRPGTRLPSVRDLASNLGVSIGSIASSWAALKRNNLITTHGRGGTVVCFPPTPVPTNPAHGFVSWRDVDLVSGSSDPELLPELTPHIVNSLADSRLHSVDREDVTTSLRSALALTWPFMAQDWTTAGGGTEGLLLAIAAATPRGCTILVDEPVTPGLLDTVAALGVNAVAVDSDDDGPLPGSLAHLIDRYRPTALLIQPCAPFSSGRVLAAERVDSLVKTLSDNDIWILEDDAFGPLSSNPPTTVGALLPDRTIRIRSYCRAYGVDLRTSVIGGARVLVDLVRQQRSYGTGVNSRILQNTLASLLLSPNEDKALEHARRIYKDRHDVFAKALIDRGIHAHTGEDGYVIWVSVSHSAHTIATLARHGVIVTTGDSSYLKQQGDDLIRIVTTRLPNDNGRIEELAELIADAILGSLREYFD